MGRNGKCWNQTTNEVCITAECVYGEVFVFKNNIKRFSEVHNTMYGNGAGNMSFAVFCENS